MSRQICQEDLSFLLWNIKELGGITMEDGQELFTIQEVIRLTRVSQNTLYRYIRQGKIKTCKVIKSGKQVITIEKQELERFLSSSVKGDTTTGKQDTTNDSIYTTTGKQDTTIGSIYDKTLTKSDIKELFQELIQEQNTLIMKPLEEQSLYRLGRIEQENTFLRAKVETLLQELEQYKSLPGPAELEQIQKEKSDLLSRAEAQEDKHRGELEGIKGKYEDQLQKVIYLQKEKEDLLSRAETMQVEQEIRHRTEIEKQQKQVQTMEEAHWQELEQVRKQAEEREKQIAEAWKKELEEAKRPWWKFW